MQRLPSESASWSLVARRFEYFAKFSKTYLSFRRQRRNLVCAGPVVGVTAVVVPRLSQSPHRQNSITSAEPGNGGKRRLSLHDSKSLLETESCSQMATRPQSRSSQLLWCAQRVFRLLRQILKRGCVFHGQIRENLAIEFEPGLFQPADKSRIAQAVLLGGGADAHDPERAELALALLASRIGELQAALDGLFRGAIEF